MNWNESALWVATWILIDGTYSMALIVLAYPLLTPMSKLLSFTAATIIAMSVDSLAATLAVLPGTSIQAKIDQAQPGDVIAIFGGTYAEDLTISKSVRLVEVSGQQVILTGSITFSGVTDAPPFEGFTQGSSGRGITVNNTTGLVLRNIDARSGTGVTATGSSAARIMSSQCSAINASGAMLELVDTSVTGSVYQGTGTMHVLRSTVSGNIDTGTGAQKTVAFRTTVNGDNNWRSKKAWFGYCDTRSFNYHDQTDGKVVVVGCNIDRQNGEANGLYFGGTNCDILVANNIVKNVMWGWGGDGENGLDGRGSANNYVIVNNYFGLRHNGGHGAAGAGVYLRNSVKAKVLNNIVESAHWGILAGFGVVAKNNYYYNMPWNTDDNGVIAEGLVKGDPKFIADQAPLLAADSPCLNAGVDDPIYANRDGSRNTIGPSGGTLYDPDARTTENPVVISFDLGPEQVLEGEATDIILSNGQAVSQP